MERSADVVQDIESGVTRVGRFQRVCGIFSPVLIQSFTLTFLAEWGDRSQITTIVLAASEVSDFVAYDSNANLIL